VSWLTPRKPEEPIKRIKRIGFGFRNFENYRIRALLYAGRPNWRVLGSIVVR
jgi:transposase